ncbi:hypothetical protein [Moorena sp. SIO4G3]|nr:hypothetical protein [Moorena sp. SIO4G3]
MFLTDQTGTVTVVKSAVASIYDASGADFADLYSSNAGNMPNTKPRYTGV